MATACQIDCFSVVYGFPFLLEIHWNRRNILEHFETRLIKNMI